MIVENAKSNKTEDIYRSPEDLYPITELAKILSIDYSYLYKWACQRQEIVPYYRGVWKLSLSEVIDFLARKSREKLGGTKVWQE